MSSSCLIRWIERLLFGTSDSSPISWAHAPPEFQEIVLRMEAENILWDDILLHGGLTAFPYLVHGDLNYLMDSLEASSPLPSRPLPLKTRAVTKFWAQLQMLWSRRDETPRPSLPSPSPRDDDILRALLDEHHPGPHAFQSAAFWGEIARKCLHLHRPVTPSALPTVSDEHAQRLLQLYEVTCLAQGQRFDPFHLVLVHHVEHVPAAHWQTPENLQAFLHDRPSHPLTLSVQSLLGRTVEQVLQGERPSALLTPCPPLDAFLHNLRVVDDSMEPVSQPHTPPRLIDLFQRLLALCHRDHLWERRVPVLEPREPVVGTSLFHLTERLRVAEREKRLLWSRFLSDEEEFGSKTP